MSRGAARNDPHLLVLDSELPWDGTSGVLEVMLEDEDFSMVPVVLLNETAGEDSIDADPQTWPLDEDDSTLLLMRSGESIPFLWSAEPERHPDRPRWTASIAIPSIFDSSNKRFRKTQVVDQLLKPVEPSELLDCIAMVLARPTKP